MAINKQAGGLLLVASLLLVGARAPATFEISILAEHNLERGQLGLKPLHWNDELAQGAEEWSEYLAATGRFEHSPDAPNQLRIGENIWGGTTGKFGPRRMVAAWVAEKRHFKPGVFPENSTTRRVEDVSHYTQIIWRDTQEVGCSVSRGRNEEILVCRYQSPGNVIGSRPT